MYVTYEPKLLRSTSSHVSIFSVGHLEENAEAMGNGRVNFMEGDWDPELPCRKSPDKYHIELQYEREINILCVKHLKFRSLSVKAVSNT